ncbi:hypothetical protein LTR60_000881, partial [Cryomyces antarcticus]
MSFGFGSSGFGANQQQQQQQGTGFGGFGASNNNAGGFGSTGTNTGFGANANTAGGSVFGGTNTTGGFGSGGFGATNQNTSPFGAKPAFGVTGGGLFGGGTTATGNTGFGGFGATNTSTNTTPAFGGGSNTGGLFGAQNKPAFGGNTTGGVFGNNTSSGGFGASPAPAAGGFGAPASTAFAGNIQNQNQGTASTPFSAHTEKDGATNQNSSYQSITFMQPYQNFSFEELRLADYAQGRRYGNQNGQAGAFGTSTGFGGFGSTNTSNTGTSSFGNTTGVTGGGLFGGQAATSSPFGGVQQTTGTGFGASNSNNGGLFGSQAPKPAGGVFGTTPATSGQQTGGLFGSTAPGGTGFGSGTTGAFGSGTTGAFGSGTTSAFGSGTTGAFGSGTTGGGVFGQQAQTQPKPAFGGFGTGTSGGFGTGTTGGFGQNQTASTGGGVFGGGAAAANTSPFGSVQQQQTANSSPFGGFGQNNQTQGQNQPQTGSGGLFGGGFGNNNNDQQKPGSLFGGAPTNTSGGLFGTQNQSQQQAGSLFGNTGAQQQSGGLFGSKPAASGSSPFGGATTTSFGNLGDNQNQQNQGSSLFGQNNQQQQKPGGLFGSTNATSGTSNSGLFGNLGQNSNNNQQQQSTSLFGSNQQNQQPQLGGSLFGNSQQNMQQSQQPQGLQTSLNATNPYGNDQLFLNLAMTSPPVGPIATPLSNSIKQRKPAILPQYKLNPQASARLITPQKKPGYGFTYSTYGTPGSAFSNTSSAGHGNSLLGLGSFGRKSYSTSSLRHSYSIEDSVLAPGAFSANPARFYAGTGGLKRLNIDRNLRTDLFGTGSNNGSPNALKKRVSFDASTAGGNAQTDGSASPGPSNALVRTESDSATPSAEEQGLLRSSRLSENGSKANGAPAETEMEQAKGNELAVVHEDGSPPAIGKKTAPTLSVSQKDQKPGKYWTTPTIDELRKMPKDELKGLSGFVVGRDGVGKIEFGKVDLSSVPLDKIKGEIVQLEIRSATVYLDNERKPPPGKGLNVPSKITLENSWPRARAGQVPVHDRKGASYQKHIERLKRVGDTEFISYDPAIGIWTFTVQHFTTYGLNYDEEEEDLDGSALSTSKLSATPDTPTPATRTPASRHSQVSRASLEDTPMMSMDDSSPDDTFGHKKKLILPGGFGDHSIVDDEDMTDGQVIDGQGEDHVDDSKPSPSEEGFDEQITRTREDMMSGVNEVATDEEQEMAGSFPNPNRITGHAGISNFKEFTGPKSILKSTRSVFGTPSKGNLEIGADWTEQLRRTVSPKKQDRQALRESQGAALKERDGNRDGKPKASVVGKGFTTSIDLMNSLFGKDTQATLGRGMKNGAKGKSFEWPYAKRPKTGDDYDSMDETEKAWHQSVKPSWTSDGTFVYAMPGNARTMQERVMVNLKGSLVSEGKDIRFAKFVKFDDHAPRTLVEQRGHTSIEIVDGLPYAHIPDTSTNGGAPFSFADFANLVDTSTAAGAHEQRVWQLASILFDDCIVDIPASLPEEERGDLEGRLRKDKLSRFWKTLVEPAAATHVADAKSPEEKALAQLTQNDVWEACGALLDGKDFRLATMLAQLPGNEKLREEVALQIVSWRDLNVLSEVSEPVRALYELLSGNTCVCQGKTSAGNEDRASTFAIAKRFGLDWRRAFGLRLWYGIVPDASLVSAVEQFNDDILDEIEEVVPVPWFVEQGKDMGWTDPDAQERGDLLWGLLKIHAARFSKEVDADLPALLSPATTSGHPLNARLSFQLAHLLHARGIAFFSDTYTSDNGAVEEEGDETMDAITLSYASQLANASEDWTTAIWALLHLSRPRARETAVMDLLCHHAPDIDIDEAPLPSSTFAILTKDLQIPESWVFRAKALHAHSTAEFTAEVHHLLHAHAYDTAHEVFCRTVAPRCVIERDTDTLRELLGGFDGVEDVDGWNLGGAVYCDYVHLLDLLCAASSDHGAAQE